MTQVHADGFAAPAEFLRLHTSHVPAVSHATPDRSRAGGFHAIRVPPLGLEPFLLEPTSLSWIGSLVVGMDCSLQVVAILIVIRPKVQ